MYFKFRLNSLKRNEMKHRENEFFFFCCLGKLNSQVDNEFFFFFLHVIYSIGCFLLTVHSIILYSFYKQQQQKNEANK